MESTLLRFATDGLREASLALLDRLGMKYTLGAAQAVSIRDLCANLNLSKAAEAALNAVTSTFFVAQIDQRTFDSGLEAVAVNAALNEARQEKYNGMFVFAIEVETTIHITRTLAATLTRVFNRLAYNKPVVLFIRQGDTLSISTCERSDYAQQWLGGEKMGKVSILRDINCRKPHRGHLNLLARMTGGAANFDDLYKRWIETFDVKLLSKKFYNEMFEWYQWAKRLVGNQTMNFPAYPRDGYDK